MMTTPRQLDSWYASSYDACYNEATWLTPWIMTSPHKDVAAAPSSQSASVYHSHGWPDSLSRSSTVSLEEEWSYLPPLDSTTPTLFFRQENTATRKEVNGSFINTISYLYPITEETTAESPSPTYLQRPERQREEVSGDGGHGMEGQA
jgi:hypothetical protein